MKNSALSTLVLLLCFFVGTSFAVEVTVFGPAKYLRTTGQPNIYTGTFPAIMGKGKLILENGDATGKNRISSALIYVNGKQILGPNVFNQQVYNLEVPVTLTGNNLISVELRSKSGSYVTVQIKQIIPGDGAAFVRPEGGVVTVTDVSSPIIGTSVIIPTNSLSSESLITISKIDNPPPHSDWTEFNRPSNKFLFNYSPSRFCTSKNPK